MKSQAPSLLIRNVEIDGQAGLDVLIEGGKIAAIETGLSHTGPSIDGGGGALIPGLVDHHIHLLATARQRQSIDLSAASTRAQFAEMLRDAVSRRTKGTWLRATRFDPSQMELPTRAELDTILPDHPARIQDRTGALWLLNSAAIERLDLTNAPNGLERDEAGQPTGQLWREDGWLSSQIGIDILDLAPLGQELAAAGITALTDASVNTDSKRAAFLAAARATGALPQKLTLMSGHALPVSPHYQLGCMKILPDERDLPSLEDMTGLIKTARSENRCVAVHCVTEAELALTLAALMEIGTKPGDRIEHGSMITPDYIDLIKSMGLIVVTQSGFICARGDRYLRDIPADELGNLYRCRSLISAGIKVAGSSDAPYGPTDPWAAMRAAVRRKTQSGQAICQSEAISARAALDLYLAPANAPGQPRRVKTGMPADLCLLDAPLNIALAKLSSRHVAAALVDGAIIYQRQA